MKRSSAILTKSEAEVQQHCVQWHGSIPTPGCIDPSVEGTNRNFLFTVKVPKYHDDMSP